MESEPLKPILKLPGEYLTKTMTRTRKKVDNVVLLPFTNDDINELLEWLYQEEELREFEHGLKTDIISENTIKEYITKLYTANDVYQGFRIMIRTPYQAVIPIGVVYLTQKQENDKKVIVNKLYVCHKWQKAGYEELSINAIVDY